LKVLKAQKGQTCSTWDKWNGNILSYGRLGFTLLKKVNKY